MQYKVLGLMFDASQLELPLAIRLSLAYKLNVITIGYNKQELLSLMKLYHFTTNFIKLLAAVLFFLYVLSQSKVKKGNMN